MSRFALALCLLVGLVVPAVAQGDVPVGPVIPPIDYAPGMQAMLNTIAASVAQASPFLLAIFGIVVAPMVVVKLVQVLRTL